MYGIYIDKITKIGQGGISPYEWHAGGSLDKPLQGTAFTSMREKILNLPNNASTNMHRNL